MKKLVLIAVSVAVLVGLGFMIDAQSHTPIVRPPDGSSQSCLIYALGRVEGATPEVELRPQLSGRVERLFVQEGQFVEQGEVILQLDDEQHCHQVAFAAAELDLAEARLQRLLHGAHPHERSEAHALLAAKQAGFDRAELSWQRIRQLRKTRVVSQQEADNERLLVRTLGAEVAAAKARLERLEAKARADEVQIEEARIAAARTKLELVNVQLQRTQLRAPSRGQILKIAVERGELAGPDSPEPAVILADTTQLHVRAFVEELDAPRVRIGMTARIRADGLPGQEFNGRVVRLSPRMGRKQLWSNAPTERYDTKMREVWIKLEKALGLVVGLRVDVTICP